MPPPLCYRLKPPVGPHPSIGIIGAGFIVDDCHLPAYRDAGFPIRSIWSRDTNKARTVAARHGIDVAHADWKTLLDDRNIQILDVAVPPDAQPEVILAACERPHILGILAQKPLAMDPTQAALLVKACESAGKVLVVNQNMRHDQAVRACTHLIRSGWLGEPVLATIDLRAIPHWMPWCEKLTSLSTYIMSIHHLDTFRYWFGSPERVFGSTTQDPRTKFNHKDGINLYILEYDSGLRASAWDDVWTGPAKEGASSDIYIRWRIEGTEGTARGTIGWPSYPTKTPSTLEFTNIKTQCWLKPEWTEAWFPDAFVGTMSQLLVAIEKNQQPEVSGQDNLETIALCEAIFQSSQSHKVLSPALFR